MKDDSDDEELTCGLSVEREVGATGFIWVRRTVQRSSGGLTGTPGSGHQVLGLLDLSRGLASNPSRPRPPRPCPHLPHPLGTKVCIPRSIRLDVQKLTLIPDVGVPTTLHSRANYRCARTAPPPSTDI